MISFISLINDPQSHLSADTHKLYTMDPVAEFQKLPLVTRSWLGLTLLVTAGVNMDVIPVSQVVMPIMANSSSSSLSWHHVLVDKLELWRLFTSFCLAGQLPDTFGILFLLYNIYVHMRGYERNPFVGGSGSRTADTMWAFVTCVVGILASLPLLQYIPYASPRYSMILTRHLSYSIMYLWARRNPDADMQINFFPLKGKWLPLAHIGIAHLMNNPLQPLLHGIAVGHVVFFLIYVIPQQTGKRVWKTPSILVDLVGGHDGDFHADDGPVEPLHRPAPPQERLRRQQHAMMERDGATPAHVAAKTGDLARLQQLFSSTTTRHMLTTPDRNQWLPLHEAIRGAHLECVRFLLTSEPHVLDAHRTTRTGETPLALAQRCHGEDHPVTRLVMEHETTTETVSTS
jgi:hypothetical protein